MAYNSGRNFGNRRNQRRNFNRRLREMYDAVCSDCKQSCKVPFKPAQDRPVYCRDCYQSRKPSY